MSDSERNITQSHRYTREEYTDACLTFMGFDPRDDPTAKSGFGKILKQRYYSLAKQCHPDRRKDEMDGNKTDFQKLNAAYTFLSGSGKSENYGFINENTKPNGHTARREENFIRNMIIVCIASAIIGRMGKLWMRNRIHRRNEKRKR